jgi:hypothetical protein
MFHNELLLHLINYLLWEQHGKPFSYPVLILLKLLHCVSDLFSLLF